MGKMIRVSHEDPVFRSFMLFMQMAQAAYKYSDRRFYGVGVTTATFLALKGLIRKGGVMTHSELATWTNTEKHNITTLVNRMKRDGLVTSDYSTVDRRVAHITVTEKGREVFDQVTPASWEIMGRVMQGIGLDKAAQLEKVLKVMKSNVEKELSHRERTLNTKPE